MLGNIRHICQRGVGIDEIMSRCICPFQSDEEDYSVALAVVYSHLHGGTTLLLPLLPHARIEHPLLPPRQAMLYM